MNIGTIVPPVDLQTLLNVIPGNHIFLLPDAPTYTIIGATDSFLQTSYCTREQLIGKPLFDIFPDNDADEAPTGVSNLRASLNLVVEQKKAHKMADQRYDIINPTTGAFELKVWTASNKPVLDADGAIQCIIHTTEDITDKVRLQEDNEVKGEQLEESQNRFRRMVEQAPLPILLSRGDDVVIESLNASMLKMMNKSSFEEVLGKKMADALPELQDQAVLQIVKDVQKTGIPFRGYEVPVDVSIKGQIKRHYYDFSYTPIIETNHVTGVLHVAIDVTQQVEARKKIEEVNTELQFVTDTMPQLVWATEASGDAYFFNKGWLEYTGLPFEEVKGNGWMQSLHPEDLDRTTNAWTHAFKDGATYDIEYRLRRYDGEYRWFLTRGTPMKDEDGNIIKWYGTTTDVHEQKRSAEALQQSTERFDLVAKATQDAIWDWNLLTNEIWWNEGFKELFGYKAEDIEPTIDSWYNRVHPDDKDRVVGDIHDTIDKGGKNWSAEYRFRKKDGSYAIVFDRGYALHDSKGQPYRMLGSMQDITERKKGEEELERKVKERTAELQVANQELKRSNKNLEEFAYAASHDLKEPVRKINVFSHRLKDSLGERINESEKKYFERMELASIRMNTLIDDLLMYSEVSQQTVLEQEADLNFIIESVLSDLDLEIEQKGAIIKVSKLFILKGNRRQLQQAFQNLIANALKYSKPNVAPVITIDCSKVIGSETGLQLSAEEAAKMFYQVTVEDNGIGFEQEDAERIFNVFTRLHGMAEFKGSGVGLSIVRKVIENHNGYIWAESQPGEGASFRILFPVEPHSVS